jgi:uracil-DNA glycosylase
VKSFATGAADATEDPREAQLHDGHVLPLMNVVRDLRAQGLIVPNVDPNDGGVNARVLVLLETPGPKAVASGFVSRDNPDPTARNLGLVLDEAGLLRSDVVVWNVVPYCLSTAVKNRNASLAEIREALPALQAFIDQLPKLAVVVFCGRSAQRAVGRVRFPSHVRILKTFHTGTKSYRRSRCRADIHAKFKEAAWLVRDEPVT